MILGLLAGFWSALLGWQINLIAIQRGIERGRSATFLVGMGAMVADLIFIWTGFTGAIPLLRYPHNWMILKWVGIATILSVALRNLFKTYKPYIPEGKIKNKKSTKNFLIGFLVVIGNPGIFLLWVGVVSFIVTHFSAASRRYFYLEFMLAFLCGCASWFVILSRIFLPKMRLWKEKRFQIISRISAVALLTVAVVLIFKKF